MFTEETVFILGAGASWHYGYPTGETLIEELINKGRQLVEILGRGRGITSSVLLRVPDRYFSNFEINNSALKFKESCEKFILSLGQVNPLVIDNFLSSQPPQIREAGKFLIAWAILECEYVYLFESNNSNKNNYNQNRSKIKREDGFDVGCGNLSYCKDDWYRFIVHKLVNGCSSTLMHSVNPSNVLKENKVKFITFNYDVSLETSLLRAFKAMPEYFSEQDINLFMSDDRFLHIYGSIRENNFGEFLTFDKDDSVIDHIPKIYDASKSIETIEEVDDDEKNGKNKRSHIIEAARLAIKEAKNIYILGYGFDLRNNTRIALHELSTKADGNKTVYFTNYEDNDSINKRVNKLWDLPSHSSTSKGEAYYRGSANIILPHYAYSSERASGYQTNSYDRSTRSVYGAFEKDFDFL